MHQALIRHFFQLIFGGPNGSSVVLLHLRNNNIPNGKDNFRYEWASFTRQLRFCRGVGTLLHLYNFLFPPKILGSWFPELKALMWCKVPLGAPLYTSLERKRDQKTFSSSTSLRPLRIHACLGHGSGQHNFRTKQSWLNSNPVRLKGGEGQAEERVGNIHQHTLMAPFFLASNSVPLSKNNGKALK